MTHQGDLPSALDATAINLRPYLRARRGEIEWNSAYVIKQDVCDKLSYYIIYIITAKYTRHEYDKLSYSNLQYNLTFGTAMSVPIRRLEYGASERNTNNCKQA